MTRSMRGATEIDLVGFSSTLDWKQFEGLAAFAFKSFGYTVFKNYRIKKPKMEIDLLAIRNSKAFAADCKHWKRTGGETSLVMAAGRQIERSKRILEREGLNEVMPIIITWHEEALSVLENGVPVVPVSKLSDFILNFDTSGEGILVVKRSHHAAIV